MNRRGFLSMLVGALAADPEKLIWEPGRKLISIPRRGLTLDDSDLLALAIVRLVAAQALPVLNSNLFMSRLLNRHYDNTFGPGANYAISANPSILTPWHSDKPLAADVSFPPSARDWSPARPRSS